MPNINIGKKFERLETLIKESFVRMDRRFQGVDRSFSSIRSEITDDIGRMVKRGFDHVDERFAQMEERFSTIDARFDRVDRRFTIMENRFDNVDTQLASANRRLDLAVYQPELLRLEARVTTLERRGRLRKS